MCCFSWGANLIGLAGLWQATTRSLSRTRRPPSRSIPGFAIFQISSRRQSQTRPDLSLQGLCVCSLDLRPRSTNSAYRGISADIINAALGKELCYSTRTLETPPCDTRKGRHIGSESAAPRASRCERLHCIKQAWASAGAACGTACCMRAGSSSTLLSIMANSKADVPFASQRNRLHRQDACRRHQGA